MRLRLGRFVFGLAMEGGGYVVICVSLSFPGSGGGVYRGLFLEWWVWEGWGWGERWLVGCPSGLS